MYDPRTNSWTPFMRMGARRLQFGVAVMQNKLIVVGGRDGLKTLNSVIINFDLQMTHLVELIYTLVFV